MIRDAVIGDVPQIKSLVNRCAESGAVLPVSVIDIYDSLRDFIVYDEDAHIFGVCSLRIAWEDLAEIRSLVVEPEHRSKKVGLHLVEREILEAKKIGVEKVFTLTTSPGFFVNIGFKEIEKGTLPHKIWRDCIKCVKFPNCDEVAMLRKV